MDFLLKMRLVVLVVDSFDSGVYVKHLFRSFSMIYGERYCFICDAYDYASSSV